MSAERKLPTAVSSSSNMRNTHKPIPSLSTSGDQSSPVNKKKETSAKSTTMVGNNPTEEVLASCKATAMIYNDAQKKWIHCAPNGPAKIQLLFTPDTQLYRIVGRQIQDHEVVLNHSISKGIKHNQATPTFHQWRDQSCVYGLNFSSKLDAQEFGAAMTKILDIVNGSNNVSSQTSATNGGATLLSSTTNTTNDGVTPTYKRQSSQPPSSLPSTSTTISINSASNSSSSSSAASETQHHQQQQQQHSSSSYTNQQRQKPNSVNSTLTSASNNYYSQHNQTIEEEDTNYALISDSYSSYSDHSNNKVTSTSSVLTLNPTMSGIGSTPSLAPPPPPPPPPPPLPNGFSGGSPAVPTMNLSASNGNGTNSARKISTTNSAPQMDLMSEMAAKFAQRRKHVDENEKSDSSSLISSKSSTKAVTTLASTSTTASGSVSTSPRVSRNVGEPHSATQYSANDLEKLKNDILTEVRKDIEKAKQEILAAILDNQKQTRK